MKEEEEIGSKNGGEQLLRGGKEGKGRGRGGNRGTATKTFMGL